MNLNLCLFFSQTKGLLPNLQEGLDDSRPDPDDVVWARISKQAAIECDVRFLEPLDWEAPDKDLGVALVEWFR